MAIVKNHATRYLHAIFADNRDFIVLGERGRQHVEAMAVKFGCNVINVDLDDISMLDDFTSGQALHGKNSLWFDPIRQDINKRYVLIFNIDQADDNTINAIKSITDLHVGPNPKFPNLQICVQCTNSKKEVPSLIIHGVLFYIVIFEQ